MSFAGLPPRWTPGFNSVVPIALLYLVTEALPIEARTKTDLPLIGTMVFIELSGVADPQGDYAKPNLIDPGDSTSAGDVSRPRHPITWRASSCRA
jgi:hypothetical protein